MRSRIRYVFSTMYEFMQKHVFLKVSLKIGCFMVSLNIICFHMHTSSLSLFPGRAYIYIWSVYFLNYWHLASPFPAPEWSFLIKLTSFAFPQALLLEE